MTNRLIVALDTPGLTKAIDLAEALAPHVGMFKIGLELFCAHGNVAVHEIAERGPVMLDLKLHDIPTTVERTVEVLARLPVMMLTVHAAGGPRMVAAAKRAAGGALVLAVTKLTSQGDTPGEVLRLARDAMEGGADGLVCSPWDANMLRFELNPMLVCPGVRPKGAIDDDHARPLTPAQAMIEGADWLVVGRPITRAADPVAAALGRWQREHQ